MPPQPHGGKLKELLVSDEEERNKLRQHAFGLPRIHLNPRQVCDLELLLNGGFSPLEGFMEEEDYNFVVSSMHLRDGTFWPIPVTLDLPSDLEVKVGQNVTLCDEFGIPLAVLSVSSIYTPDKYKEAVSVYGTDDLSHPGVKYLLEETNRIYIGGKVRGIDYPERYEFYELRHTPRELRNLFEDRGWERVIGFQTRNPIHRAHFEIIKRMAESENAKVLIHPVVGVTKDDDIDYITRVKCYKKLCENYASNFAELSLLPLSMRMAGPREALLHAVIRKNYGCSHFIVGRDHAGPKNSQGKAFYEPYAAQELAKAHEKELGIRILPVKEMVYVEEEGCYLFSDELKPHHTVKTISGTKLRELIREGREIPDWFSFPEVIEELKKNTLAGQTPGATIFFTGLPAAGKSTIARLVFAKLAKLSSREVKILDGDIARKTFSRGLGFSREDRNINIARIGSVANEITRHGGIAVCAAIAPFEEARLRNRERIQRNGHYIEVFVNTPLEICKKRDPKGLYALAEAGQIKNFTGVDDPYEVPQNPELTLDTTEKSPEECAELVISYLKRIGLLES